MKRERKVIKFYTGYFRPEEREQEVNDGPVMVEKAGYVPMKQRVEALMIAGRRLEQIGPERYDFGDPDQVDDDMQIDPTRKGDFDMVDAQNMIAELQERMEERHRKEQMQLDKIEEAVSSTIEQPSEQPEEGKEVPQPPEKPKA